jgi:aspartate/glutamate/glutamine transport system permease protein
MTEVWEVLARHLSDFADGLLVTLRLVGASLAIALSVGVLIGGMRVSPVRALRWIGTLYVELFRNIPLLILLFIAFLGLRRMGIPVGPWLAGTASLGLYTAAFVAEAVRSGLFAVPKGQMEAALSLGFTSRRAMARVVLPQAVRTVIPPLGNVVIAMIKNSAIIGASILAIPDLLKQARIIDARTGQTHELFLWTAVGYLLLTVTATFAVRYLERRLAIRR